LRARTDSNVAALSDVSLGPPPSLDPSALLPWAPQAVVVTLYPEAGEATALYLVGGEKSGNGTHIPLAPRDPELILQDGGRRAKGEIRRQIRRNRGRYLWTFTYADAHYDYGQVVREVRRFMERLREEFGRVWFLMVPEPHPGGHGWHLHAAANERLDIKKMRAAWGHGHVWVGDHKKKRARWNSRKLSRYLAKYATKVLDPDQLHGCEPRQKGQHRYWVTQGFEPRKVSYYATSMGEAAAWLQQMMGMADELRQLDFDAGIPIRGYWLGYDDRWLWPPEPPAAT
jgi:hypothetical protein